MTLPAYPPSPADHAERAAWLDEVAARTQTEFEASRARGVVWSTARLLTFASAVAGAYYYLGQEASWGAAVALGGAVLFVWARRRHDAVKERTLVLALTGEVVGEARRRIDGKPVIVRSVVGPDDQAVWDAFLDAYGFDDPSFELARQEEDDLDLFGEPLSLFGLLNRTSSPVGAARLARAIVRPLSSIEAIEARQAGVRWLSEHGPERLHLMAAAGPMRAETKSCAKFLAAVRDATALPGRIPARLLRWWGLAGPIALGVGAAESFGWTVWGVGWLPLAGTVLVNLVLAQWFMKEVRERLQPWLELDQVVNRLHFFARTAAEALPDDGVLGEQRRRLAATLGRGCLPALERTIPLLYLGLSGVLHAMIDVLVFWDLQVLAVLERSYLAHREQLLDAVAALGECEMLASLACLAAEEPDANWPTFCSGGCRLEIDEGRHPLIAAGQAVSNSVSLSEAASTWIVAGSNMSGKSTFLRMAAVNVLLAQIGSAVTARRLTLTPMQILTDLRIRDDLSRQESYFLAEVRQVRRMIESAAAGRAVFGLIDEPFRGTNSEERIAAASAVIVSLVEGSGVYLVATHDAALTQLADGKRAVNYHFAESLDGDRLVFDYRLHGGPAESRNALKVLENESYPPELTARARRILSNLQMPRVSAGDPPTEAPEP